MTISTGPGYSLEGSLFYTLRAFETGRLQGTTKKTIFLISLATAKIIGELQGLNYKIAMVQEDIILAYLCNFFPKTDHSDRPLTREFSLKSSLTHCRELR